MTRFTRRRFLSATALAALASGRTSPAAPSERIQVAFLGLRGRGNSLLGTFLTQKDVDVTHLCDVDENVLKARSAFVEKQTGRAPRTAKDYRSILDDKNVHAIVVATPDHWHALPTIHGCQAGKDVYVEKPDGHNIQEGKAMVAAARKHARIVQMGTQSRSAPFIAAAAKFVSSGAIGRVLFGRAWETSRQPEIPRVPDGPVPAGVDYERWLGPAPERPFNRYRFHGNWRWFFDTGTGDLGNDGVHRMDYCRWVMGAEGFPTGVSASGGKFVFDDAQEWPDTLQVTYEYPGKILVYEMRIGAESRLHGHGEGAEVIGEKGRVVLNNSTWKAFDGDERVLAEGGDREADVRHVRNFLDAVKSRRREDLAQEIAQGHASSVMCHAGNIAWRTGKKLKFDPKSETFDDAEANRWLGREYRKGYELPRVE